MIHNGSTLNSYIDHTNIICATNLNEDVSIFLKFIDETNQILFLENQPRRSIHPIWSLRRCSAC